MLLRVLPVVVLLAALIWFAGATEVALILLGVGVVALVVVRLARRPARPQEPHDRP